MLLLKFLLVKSSYFEFSLRYHCKSHARIKLKIGKLPQAVDPPSENQFSPVKVSSDISEMNNN